MPNLNISISASWQYGDYAPAADPNAALEASIEILNARITDMTDVFRKIAVEVLEPAVEQQIESEGRFLGTPWAPLAPATVKDRQKKGYGGPHPMLVREGTLRESFREGGADHVQEIEPAEMTWGSALPKSLYLHTGTQEGYHIGRSSLGKLGYAISKLQGAKNIGMPGRPLFQMSEGVSASILEQFSQAMAAAATEAQIQVDPGVGKS